MEWTEWVQEVTGGASARQIAARTHRSHTTVSRWIRDGGAPADVVLNIAKAFGGDPIQGLLAAGLLTLEDLRPALRAGLSAAPQTLLTAELHRRSQAWTHARVQGYDFEPWWFDGLPDQ